MFGRADARGVVLISHGLGETMAERLEIARAFYDLGFAVFMYDYGGYWKSTGRPSERRCHQDARAAWQYLVEEQGYAPDRIVVFGESMGTGPSVDLAYSVKPAALILLSPFTSLTDVLHERLPIFPYSILLRHKYDNAAKIAGVTCPILTFHGDRDQEVPFDQGLRLFTLAREPKTFRRLNGGHGAFWEDRAAFVADVRSFLDEHLPMANVPSVGTHVVE